MRAEMGSFSGRGGVTVGGPRGGIRSASSFSAEKTGALSFKIGPTKAPRSGGLKLSEFRAPSPVVRSERKVANFTSLKTAEWKPASISQKTDRRSVTFSPKVEPRLFAKPVGEKAGIAPYKKTIFTERKAFAQFPAPTERKSLRVALPEQKKHVFNNTRQRIERPQVKPVIRNSQDIMLEKKVALAYLNLGLAKDKKEAEKKVARIVSEKISRQDWQPKPVKAKELILPKTEWKPNEQKKPVKVAPDVQRKVDALKQVKIIKELRAMTNSSPAIDTAINRVAKMPEQTKLVPKKLEQQKRLFAIKSLMLKKEASKEEKKKFFYVEDTTASTARINLALSTAAKLFARRFFRDNGRGKITGDKIADHLPSQAQGAAISNLVRGRHSKFDGSYIEWRDKLAKMGEKKSVGEVVAAARSANESSPPVKATKEKKTREVTMKDVLRVLLGAKEDER